MRGMLGIVVAVCCVVSIQAMGITEAGLGHAWAEEVRFESAKSAEVLTKIPVNRDIRIHVLSVDGGTVPSKMTYSISFRPIFVDKRSKYDAETGLELVKGITKRKSNWLYFPSDIAYVEEYGNHPLKGKVFDFTAVDFNVEAANVYAGTQTGGRVNLTPQLQKQMEAGQFEIRGLFCLHRAMTNHLLRSSQVTKCMEIPDLDYITTPRKLTLTRQDTGEQVTFTIHVKLQDSDPRM